MVTEDKLWVYAHWVLLTKVLSCRYSFLYRHSSLSKYQEQNSKRRREIPFQRDLICLLCLFKNMSAMTLLLLPYFGS